MKANLRSVFLIQLTLSTPDIQSTELDSLNHCLTHAPSVGNIIKHIDFFLYLSLSLIAVAGNDGAVVKSSANGLVGTGFAPRYRLQPRAVF